MKIFRIALPIYKKILKKLSHGKGYGKKKSVRNILKFFDMLFYSREVEVHGHRMYLPRKGFAEYSTLGIYGELDTLTVEKILQPGDYVLDIGAAIGYYTLILARAVKKNGLVIAFEPKEERCKILTKNLQINQYKNVKLENKAILPKGINSKFFSRPDGKAGLRFLTDPEKKYDYLETFTFTNPVQVSSVDLDEYLTNLGILEKVSFMKIDVDGPELLVLQSAKSLLKNNNLKIFLEWDQESAKWSSCDPVAIIDLLLENNFKIFYPDYKKGKFFPINKNELLAIIKPEDTINILCVKQHSLLENLGIL